MLTRLKVASFAEAWIEIAKEISIVDALKKVASFAEAWIEIKKCAEGVAKKGRLLRGGVD